MVDAPASAFPHRPEAPVLMAMLPPQERPRERLLARGADSLTERELLALVLRSGTRGASALDVAGALLAEYGGLRALTTARPEELAARSGIGVAKAAALVAAFQLARRVADQDVAVVLRGPADVAHAARVELDGLRRERVLVLVCDAANRLRRTVVVSEGSIDRSMLPVREILNAVLRHDRAGFRPCAQPSERRSGAERRRSPGDRGRQIGGGRRRIAIPRSRRDLRRQRLCSGIANNNNRSARTKNRRLCCFRGSAEG
jgi:DNA repair protein RadC